MKVFTRHYVHPNVTLDHHGKVYTKPDLIELVDRWHTILDHLGLKKGDAFAVNDEPSIEHTSLNLAAAERGMIFVAIPKQDLIYEHSEHFDPKALNIKMLFECSKYQKSVWNVPRFDLSRLYDFEPSSNPDITVTEDDIVLLSKTSGTTGIPKVFYHTHKSLVTSSLIAHKEFYKETDRVVIYNTFNHVSVLSAQVLPVLNAGCEIIASAGFDPIEVLDLILDKKPNKTLMFWPMIIHQLSKNPRWETCDLSHLEEVITGGMKLNKHEILKTLLVDKGVKSVINSYGLSEVLVPVSHQWLTKDNFEDFFHDDCPCVGKVLPHWEMKVLDDGCLRLRGECLAKGDAIASRSDPDGFYNTEDVVFVKDGLVYIRGRKDRSSRIGETMVNFVYLQKAITSFSISSAPFIPFVYAFARDGKLYAAIRLRNPDDKIDFASLNQYLVQQLGSDYKLSGYGFADLSFGNDNVKEVINLANIQITNID